MEPQLRVGGRLRALLMATWSCTEKRRESERPWSGILIRGLCLKDSRKLLSCLCLDLCCALFCLSKRGLRIIRIKIIMVQMTLSLFVSTFFIRTNGHFQSLFVVKSFRGCGWMEGSFTCSWIKANRTGINK